MERRLAAILAIDVVGYARLMEQDEANTFERLRIHRKELFEPEIAKHHGRIFKLIGDGLLAEFASVVDAVECAVALQRAMAERNSGLAADRRIDTRVGINLGDVIVEDEDRHGDGVNIASRLQGLADPGGVIISGTAYDQVEKKLDVGYESLGQQSVKNIDKPVRVYRLLLSPEQVGRTVDERKTTLRSWRWPAAAAIALVLVMAAGAAAWWRPWEPRIEPVSVEHMALPLPDKPSLAVLPFANMSDDPKQEYLSDGITDDLITDLSQVSGLFVISRNSTFVYKGKVVPPKQVSEELGVRYVLEGSIQRAGDRLRINAQLIDALSGGHAWADRFDGSLADVFALQDKVTRSIADALAVRLTDAEQDAFGPQETSVPAAYEEFLRGWLHIRRNTPEDYVKAIPYLKEAIKLDPNYGRAYAALALVYLMSADQAWTYSLGISIFQARQKAWQYLAEAQKHPTVLSLQAAGLLLWIEGSLVEALAKLNAAIALDPSDALSYAYMGATLTSLGRPAEGVSHIRTAMRLDPHYSAVFTYLLGLAQFALEHYDEAAASFEAVTRLNPDDEYPFAVLAATYGHLGRKADAVSAVARFNRLRVSRSNIPITIPTMPWLNFIRRVDVERVRQGLRLAGVPAVLSSGEFAEQNKLTADEVRLLFTDHRLHGHSPSTGEERAASLTTNGIAAMSGDWVIGGASLTGGAARFQGDELCFIFGFMSYCGVVLHNPGGTRAMENEFIWHFGSPYPFSQVDRMRRSAHPCRNALAR